MFIHLLRVFFWQDALHVAVTCLRFVLCWLLGVSIFYSETSAEWHLLWHAQAVTISVMVHDPSENSRAGVGLASWLSYRELD